ncbi:hypothetical protein BS78_10G274100 [Paspalum vaginatum]|nr:hypothetical protein BS78_10G274100 [Paspalum vaginatum]
MLLLAHAVACCRDRSSCQYSYCRALKALFKHGRNCKIGASSECGKCKKMWRIILLHGQSLQRTTMRCTRMQGYKGAPEEQMQRGSNNIIG